MLTIRNAAAIFADPSASEPGFEAGGTLTIRDGLVVAGTTAEANEAGIARVPADRPVDELDATGCVLTPGLVNAHHHLTQSAFRTLPGTRGVPMGDWLPAMASAYTRVGIDPELVGAAARVAIAEGLLCGVTTIADHQLNWPSLAGAGGIERSVAIATAVTDAAEHLGSRVVFVRGSARDDAEEAALSAEAIARSLVPGPGGGVVPGGVRSDGRVQVAVGPAGVHSDGEQTFRLLADVAARYGLRRRTQANEQVDVVIALERYGRRPLDLLDDWGWLEPGVTVAHLCGVTGDEIRRLAAAGVTATHAPGCDLPMGWGIAPVAALLDAGVPVGIGTSGGGSNDAGHLLADARLAMQVAPLVGRPVSAREILAMATLGSAIGLGRPDLGSLTPGSAGDVCVWDVTGVADAGVSDPVAGLLWASPGRRPRHVVVGGRVVVRDYQLVTDDERQLAASLDTLLSARTSRAG